MPEFHAVVCVKIVPKPEEIRVDPHTMLLRREDVRTEINPPDMNALEMALRLKDRYGGRVSLLSMGPPDFEHGLRTALAMGADHIYLLSDRALAGADTLATTYTLAQAVRKIGGADLIFCGEESSDGATGQVPPGLAEWLQIPQLTMLNALDIDLARRTVRGRRAAQGGYQVLQTSLPCVVSVQTAANEPRFMDYRLKPWAFADGRMTVWSADDLAAEPDLIGLGGSPTAVTGLAEAPVRTRKRRYLEGSTEAIVAQLLTLLQDVI